MRGVSTKTIVLLSVSLFFVFAAPAWNKEALTEPSSEQVGITVVPTKFEMTIDPGDTKTGAVRVVNDSPEPVTVDVYVMDYYIKPDNSFVITKPGSQSYSAAKWVTLKRRTFTLPATTGPRKSYKEEKFEVTAPDDAEPGGHYAVIFFQFKGRKSDESTAIVPKGRIGTLLLVTIPGPISRNGQIKKMLLPWVALTNKVGAGVDFANAGNVHLTTRGKVRFFEIFSGRQSASVDLPELTILPKTDRQIKTAWNHPPYVGIYEVDAEVSYGPNLFTFTTTRRITGLVVVIHWLIPTATVLLLVLRRVWQWHKTRARNRPEPEIIGELDL